MRVGAELYFFYFLFFLFGLKIIAFWKQFIINFSLRFLRIKEKINPFVKAIITEKCEELWMLSYCCNYFFGRVLLEINQFQMIFFLLLKLCKSYLQIPSRTYMILRDQMGMEFLEAHWKSEKYVWSWRIWRIFKAIC